jgi:ATP-dependent Lhr-like helicase
MGYQQIPKKVLDIIHQKFSELTQVQTVAFDAIHEGHNVVICSETGSGKTEAALLPLFTKLSESNQRLAGTTKIIYLTPLKALNRDVEERVYWLAGKLGITVGLRHGDTTQKERLELKLNPPNMLITTPESFNALISDAENLSLLTTVEHIVIDEANELIQSKRGTQLALCLARFKSYLNHSLQVICLSATIKSGKIIRDFFVGKNGKVVYLKSKRKYSITVDIINDFNNIEQIKNKIISHVNGKTLVFVNTRHLAESLAKIFDQKESFLDVHHSSLSLKMRIEVENKLKRGEIKTVIATSSLELGLDIGNLEKVVQIGSPRTVETLAQRLGRAGHSIGAKSTGTIICLNPFDLLESISCAILLQSRWLERPTIFTNSLDVLANQIVAHVLVKRETTIDELMGMIKTVYPYSRLPQEELAMVLNFLKKNKQIFIKNNSIFVGPRAKSYFYKSLSTITSIQRYRLKNIVTRQIIGELDGAFVERYCEEGKKIVLGKNAWEIVSIDYGTKMLVAKPVDPSNATVPVWSGDTLPVDKYVSQRIINMVSSKRREKIIKGLTMTSGARRILMNIPRIKVKHNSIVITKIEPTNTIVVISPLGTRGNRALAVLLEEILQEHGVTVKVYSSSMGVVINDVKISPITLRELLIDPNLNVEYAVLYGSSRYGRFTDRFFNVGRRLGLDVDLMIEKYGARRTHLMLSSTIVGREALNEILTDLLDVKTLEQVLKNRLVYVSSDQETMGLANLLIKSFLITPSVTKNTLNLANLIEGRIQNKTYKCICLSCFNYTTTIKVCDLDDRFRCPKCGSKYLGFSSTFDRNFNIAVMGLKKNLKAHDKDIKMIQNELIESAEIFLNYGKRGIVVLSGYGIGPKTAKNILRKRIIDEQQLYMEILKAEQEYIRTREFWR